MAESDQNNNSNEASVNTGALNKLNENGKGKKAEDNNKDKQNQKVPYEVYLDSLSDVNRPKLTKTIMLMFPWANEAAINLLKLTDLADISVVCEILQSKIFQESRIDSYPINSKYVRLFPCLHLIQRGGTSLSSDVSSKLNEKYKDEWGKLCGKLDMDAALLPFVNELSQVMNDYDMDLKQVQTNWAQANEIITNATVQIIEMTLDQVRATEKKLRTGAYHLECDIEDRNKMIRALQKQVKILENKEKKQGYNKELRANDCNCQQGANDGGVFGPKKRCLVPLQQEEISTIETFDSCQNLNGKKKEKANDDTSSTMSVSVPPARKRQRMVDNVQQDSMSVESELMVNNSMEMTMSMNYQDSNDCCDYSIPNAGINTDNSYNSPNSHNSDKMNHNYEPNTSTTISFNGTTYINNNNNNKNNKNNKNNNNNNNNNGHGGATNMKTQRD